MTHPTNEDVARFIEACYRVKAAMPGLKESIRAHLARTETQLHPHRRTAPDEPTRD